MASFDPLPSDDDATQRYKALQRRNVGLLVEEKRISVNATNLTEMLGFPEDSKQLNFMKQGLRKELLEKISPNELINAADRMNNSGRTAREVLELVGVDFSNPTSDVIAEMLLKRLALHRKL